MARIGVLGGAFDPIHFGHLLVADDVRRLLHLDRVLLVPTLHPPHRPPPIAAYHHRRAMTRLAADLMPGIDCFPIEETLPVPSYTLNTITAIRKRFDRPTLWLIVGADQYATLPSWYRPEEVVKIARLAVATRPGITLSPMSQKVAGKVRFLSVIKIAISASDVRARLASGQSVRYMLPVEVARYIRRHRLYRDTRLA